MSETARSVAVDLLTRVERTGAYAEPLLNAALSGDSLGDPRDRGLATQLVYGTLRVQGRLDWILRQLYRGRLADLEPVTRAILRTALYQLEFTDRIPAFAAVDAAVELAKGRVPDRASLVNAVLRAAVRKRDAIRWPDAVQDPVGHIAATASHPLWLVRRWLAVYGPGETAALCRADNETPPCTLRVNRIRLTPAAAREALAAAGLACEPTFFSPDGLAVAAGAGALGETAPFREGGLHIQDEASQLVAPLVDPRPGETLLDLCAGSGGKTTHLAALLQNSGEILAVDIHPRKLADLETLARHLGATPIRTWARNAEADLGEAFHARFDRVLVDAPCSGTGTLRRNPEIKWRLQPRDLGTLVRRQRRILDAAAAYPRRGGVLVYATCALLPEENEDVIADFLERHPEYAPDSPPPPFPAALLDEEGYFRTLPHRDGMDGFFGARLRRLG
ncbi:MAG: 16S rRNA (cytosine(967)-C(5))-methyltransferase RsmB [Syntrophales bacterium]|nr:16S rRNA (cytosine(967)-C(5))-methyltransferase RsmB [Syntrophales bacterium]HOG08566.1 16S rRNA (cytosine(967)-C(5))-methyltransferase RsmB [Syntrophales bacterium]HOS76935.1 16S rRNA (cytosine(967)-C(5))-methyltransferase RsmB [Syntrophales bacterium]HPB70531.1 16S rRNA (cytosine(967)-C(5))-methyltransferase RsmB [Syntrophales bacterium]HQN26232.1 16S rRNA (cytosine(967)-C(5))-methyltransferase RsmB [Syntrophales bacterium]